jgi:hypothetical protein
MHLESNRNFYFICKYAVHPDNKGAHSYLSGNYILSSLLSELNYKVTLISSISTGRAINLTNYKKKNNLYYYRKFNLLNHILITGINISLGFNFKRIISWLEFEIKVFCYFFDKKITKNDIVYISSLSLLTILNGLYLKHKYRCKLILEIRDIYPLTLISYKKSYKNNPIILFFSYIEKIGYKHSDLIIGTMPGLHLHIRSVINNNFNFLYLPQGFYLKNYDTDDFLTPPLTNVFNFEKENFYITYAGSIGLANGISFFFETAVIFLEKKLHNFKFILIGDGSLKETLLKKYNYPSNIILIPWLNKQDLNYYLSNSNLLFHYCLDIPIHKFGISPNKLIDYMYSGRPILTCYNGYISEIEKAKCCFKIKPGSTITIVEKIIEISELDVKYLNKLGENGKKYLLENLNYDILVRNFLLKLNDLSY